MSMQITEETDWQEDPSNNNNNNSTTWNDPLQTPLLEDVMVITQQRRRRQGMTYRSWSRLWLYGDVSMGLVTLCLVLWWRTVACTSHTLWLLQLLGTLAAVWMIRGFVGIFCGIHFEGCCFRRRGLWLSALSSALAALVYLTFFLGTWLAQGKLHAWLQQAQHRINPSLSTAGKLYHGLFYVLTNHFHALVLFFLVATVVECVRWQLLYVTWDGLVQQDDQDLLILPVEATETRRSHQHKRPWWWSSNSLDRDAQNQTNNNTGWWNSPSWWRPQHATDDASENLRDNASVDFCSVQEEWASRDEEDPFWWSREEQSTSLLNNSSNATAWTATPAKQHQTSNTPPSFDDEQPEWLTPLKKIFAKERNHCGETNKG